jgi:hypothetical protein
MRSLNNTVYICKIKDRSDWIQGYDWAFIASSGVTYIYKKPQGTFIWNQRLWNYIQNIKCDHLYLQRLWKENLCIQRWIIIWNTVDMQIFRQDHRNNIYNIRSEVIIEVIRCDCLYLEKYPNHETQIYNFRVEFIMWIKPMTQYFYEIKNNDTTFITSEVRSSQHL